MHVTQYKYKYKVLHNVVFLFHRFLIISTVVRFAGFHFSHPSEKTQDYVLNNDIFIDMLKTKKNIPIGIEVSKYQTAFHTGAIQPS